MVFKRVRYKIVHLFEEANEPLLGPNIWALKAIGFLQTDNKFKNYLGILVHELCALFVFTQYLELWFIKDDLNLVLENLSICMITIICVVKSNSFVFWQREWKELIAYVKRADLEERCLLEKSKSPRSQLLNGYTDYCRKMTYAYWILVNFTIWDRILQPLIPHLSSAEYQQYNAELKRFPHIFISWAPFDKNNAPGCWIQVSIHLFFLAYCASNVAAYDTFIVVLMMFFKGKLEILRVKCSEIFNSETNENMTYNEATARIIECHKIHVELIKYSKLLNSIMSPTMFAYVLICSLVLCSSIYQLSIATSAAHMLVTGEYLIFGVVQLLFFCWHSDIVINKSQDVILGPYESKWWSVDVKLQKLILILTGQLDHVVIFTAGPFTDLKLATFISICKGAYSFYTLLRK